MNIPAFTQRHHLWSLLLYIWFIVLWFLSSRPADEPNFHIETPDKLLHFGYFFGGSGLLSAALFLQNKWTFHWSTLHLIVILALSAVGSLDEWHQSWVPYRSGNDSADLSANILGALVGTLVFRKVQPKLFPPPL